MSEYNGAPGHYIATETAVRWALRGYLPPKHLRIPGYNYGIPEDSSASFHDAAIPKIFPKESIADLMAGCFTEGGSSGGEEQAAFVSMDASDNAGPDRLVDPNSRIVKGQMSSRPSWGQQGYTAAAAELLRDANCPVMAPA